MKRFFETECKYEDGSYALWSLIDEQGSSLAKIGVKVIKGYQEAYKKKDCI